MATRLFAVRYSREGRDAMQAYRTRAEAYSRAHELARDPQILGGVSVLEYSTKASALDALIAVMGAGSAPREAWHDERRVLSIIIPEGVRATRAKARAEKN